MAKTTHLPKTLGPVLPMPITRSGLMISAFWNCPVEGNLKIRISKSETSRLRAKRRIRMTEIPKTEGVLNIWTFEF